MTENAELGGYDHEATRAAIRDGWAVCECGERVECIAVGPVYVHVAELMNLPPTTRSEM